MNKDAALQEAVIKFQAALAMCKAQRDTAHDNCVHMAAELAFYKAKEAAVAKAQADAAEKAKLAAANADNALPNGALALAAKLMAEKPVAPKTVAAEDPEDISDNGC